MIARALGVGIVLAPFISAALLGLGRAARALRNLRPKGTPMTHTRTHVYVEFANPYLRCDLCHAWITRWHNNDKCGCTEECWLDPCSHNAEAVSACPSWSPVDGCQCKEQLGRVEHGEPPATTSAP